MNNKREKPRIIAFYLPQFHSIPENDLWWGKGFTEWTNVGKAKKLFPGHKQPKVPTDFGYYDLRLPSVREAQANLARESGVEGFCYWHYYFGDGRMLLDKPIKEVLELKTPDFPFCFGWANEPWEKKLWNKDSKGNQLLIEQKYGGIEDYKNHFYLVLPYLKDNRYLTVDKKPIFLIYKPNKIPNPKEFISVWRNLIKKEGFEDFHFIAHSDFDDEDFNKYFAMGFDAVYTNRTAKVSQDGIEQNLKRFLSIIFKVPRCFNYKRVIKFCFNEKDKDSRLYPGIICGWDHTPRSGRKGMVYTHFSLKLFKQHVKEILSLVSEKELDNKIIFLKSWNEWGEGNFMEPDMEFGNGKTQTLKTAIEEYVKGI